MYIYNCEDCKNQYVIEGKKICPHCGSDKTEDIGIPFTVEDVNELLIERKEMMENKSL